MLTSPYKTNCHHYAGGEHPTEHHCKSHCTERHMRQNFGLSLFTVTYEKSEPFPVLSKYSLYHNRSLEIDVNRILADCDRKCAVKKCRQEFYAPNIATQLDSKSIVFRLNMANGPQISSIYKPKTSLSHYLVDVLSVLSVWLGFSFLEVIRRTAMFFQK